MRLAPIITLSIVLLVAACSDDPNKQSESKSEPSSTKAVTESSQPATSVDTSTSTPAQETQTPAVAQTPAPTPLTQEPGLVPGASKLELGEYLSLSEDIFEEKCTIDPVTGKKVCTTGFCGLFGGLCDQFPFSVMQIPATIAIGNVQLVGSTVLGAAKTGLETTETGTAIVKKATNIMYRVKRAINALLTDPPEAYNTFEKTTSIGNQAMNKPKAAYPGAN